MVGKTKLAGNTMGDLFRCWPAPALFTAEFHAKRATAFHRKAKLLKSLISVLRMHPNGHEPTFDYTNCKCMVAFVVAKSTVGLNGKKCALAKFSFLSLMCLLVFLFGLPSE